MFVRKMHKIKRKKKETTCTKPPATTNIFQEEVRNIFMLLVFLIEETPDQTMNKNFLLAPGIFLHGNLVEYCQSVQ